MTSHPFDDTLMSYASGALDRHLALVVVCHMQFCKRCRDRCREFEAIGGAILEGIDPGVADDFETRAMQRFAEELGSTPQPQPVARQFVQPDPGDEYRMPGPLARVTDPSRNAIRWRDVGHGIASCQLELAPQESSGLHLVKMTKGSVLDLAAHEGGHLVLVLWGSYDEESARFRRGDLADVPGSVSHRFCASEYDECVCLVATEYGAHANQPWAFN